MLYNADFNTCIGSDGQLALGLEGKPFAFPLTDDIDFWCTNNDKSLEPMITVGDIIALKKLSNWKNYIPGKYVCVVITKDYKVLLKVAVTQDDPDSITFIQFDNDKQLECKIPKNDIHRQLHILILTSYIFLLTSHICSVLHPKPHLRA